MKIWPDFLGLRKPVKQRQRTKNITNAYQSEGQNPIYLYFVFFIVQYLLLVVH